MATTLIIWLKLVYPMTLRFRVMYTLHHSLHDYTFCDVIFLPIGFSSNSEHWSTFMSMELHKWFHDIILLVKFTDKIYFLNSIFSSFYYFKCEFKDLDLELTSLSASLDLLKMLRIHCYVVIRILEKPHWIWKRFSLVAL